MLQTGPGGVAIRKPVDGALLTKKFSRTDMNGTTDGANLLLDRETIMMSLQVHENGKLAIFDRVKHGGDRWLV